MKRMINLKHPTGGVISIKDGFSWLAFLFGPLWTLVKKLWVQSGILILISIVLYLVDGYTQHSKNIAVILLNLGLTFGFMYFCGKYANVWLRKKYEKLGYEIIPSV